MGKLYIDSWFDTVACEYFDTDPVFSVKYKLQVYNKCKNDALFKSMFQRECSRCGSKMGNQQLDKFCYYPLMWIDSTCNDAKL